MVLDNDWLQVFEYGHEEVHLRDEGTERAEKENRKRSDRKRETEKAMHREPLPQTDETCRVPDPAQRY